MSDPSVLFARERARSGAVILDGGLATELEARGIDTSGPLWSARALLEAPEAIVAVHREALLAGADVITTASYQATPAGLAEEALSPEEVRERILLSVELARRARASFLEAGRAVGRPFRPLVAASVGPYGAYLHDGSEYRGDYDLDEEALVGFHRERFALLARSGADLIACETIPSLTETRALLRLLREETDAVAWFSFQCRDERAIADGTPLRECAALVAGTPRVAAVGVNCTPPALILPLVGELRAACELPVAVYPNSGETWDPEAGGWRGTRDVADLAGRALGWHEAGATLIGGCCRVGPDAIRAIAEGLRGAAAPSWLE